MKSVLMIEKSGPAYMTRFLRDGRVIEVRPRGVHRARIMLRAHLNERDAIDYWDYPDIRSAMQAAEAWDPMQDVTPPLTAISKEVAQ
jgi:hypothetical protein